MTPAELYELVQEQVEALIAEAQEVVKDGISVRDVAVVIRAFVRRVAVIVHAISATEAEKRDLVLFCVDRFYELVIKPVNIPWVPDLVIEPALDRAIGELVHYVASEFYDMIVDLFGATLWPELPEGEWRLATILDVNRARRSA